MVSGIHNLPEQDSIEYKVRKLCKKPTYAIIITMLANLKQIKNQDKILVSDFRDEVSKKFNYYIPKSSFYDILPQLNSIGIIFYRNQKHPYAIGIKDWFDNHVGDFEDEIEETFNKYNIKGWVKL